MSRNRTGRLWASRWSSTLKVRRPVRLACSAIMHRVVPFPAQGRLAQYVAHARTRVAVIDAAETRNSNLRRAGERHPSLLRTIGLDHGGAEGTARAIRLPARSVMKRRAEPFFATQSQSATVCAPDSTMISFRPAPIANTAAYSGTLPAGMPCQRVAHRGPNSARRQDPGHVAAVLLKELIFLTAMYGEPLKKTAPMRDGDGLVHLADLIVAGMGLPGQLLLSGSAIGSLLRSTQTEDTRCVSGLPSLP